MWESNIAGVSDIGKVIGKRTRLTKQDWVDVGTEFIGLKGVGSLRIDELCAAMGVTKGSFYWHFSGREDYLKHILAGWEQRETFAIIDQLETTGGEPEEKLRALFEIANSGRVDFRAEQAIRHWAYEDRDAARVIRLADRRRLDYLTDIYLALGQDNEDAVAKATLVYSLILGEATIRRKENKKARKKRQQACFDHIHAEIQ